MADLVGYEITEETLAELYSDYMTEDDFLTDNLMNYQDDAQAGNNYCEEVNIIDYQGLQEEDEIPQEDEEQIAKDIVLKDSSQLDSSVMNLQKTQRFAAPVTDQKVISKIKSRIPHSTKRVTEWAVRLWNEWKDSQLLVNSELPPILDNEQLKYWVSNFAMEV